ncbi:MAG TPA: thioredoxin domain-containing protein [Candidatus Competibacteraceae bacterium]|nr:thioredoxin domain-containing protein [Candidatus Competibacteraceae bacterium]
MQRHTTLIIIVIAAAVLPTLSLLFARSLGGAGEQQLQALIDARIEAKLKERPPGLSDEQLAARIEQGILAFIEKQRRAQEERPSSLARNVPPPAPDDHIYGAPDAPVSLIEYSDFECPYCKRFHATAKRLVDASNGQVNWVYRHFPLDFHNPGAAKQAEAAECAAELGGNDAFWKFTDTLYERTKSNGKGFPVENLVPLAVEIGLAGPLFQQCLESGRHAGRVQRDLEDGAKAGVNGTPGNILFHKPTAKVIAIHGAQPYEQLVNAVDSLLRAAR